MISDALLRLSGTTASATAAAVGQDVVGAAGNYYSTYYLDLNSQPTFRVVLLLLKTATLAKAKTSTWSFLLQPIWLVEQA